MAAELHVTTFSFLEPKKVYFNLNIGKILLKSGASYSQVFFIYSSGSDSLEQFKQRVTRDIWLRGCLHGALEVNVE